VGVDDKKKSIKSLIDRIPTEKEALFAYEIDWAMVDSVRYTFVYCSSDQENLHDCFLCSISNKFDLLLYFQVLMEKRIRPWINKKIVEYIGEPEPTLVDFICTKVLSKSNPATILDDVQMVRGR